MKSARSIVYIPSNNNKIFKEKRNHKKLDYLHGIYIKDSFQGYEQ